MPVLRAVDDVCDHEEPDEDEREHDHRGIPEKLPCWCWRRLVPFVLLAQLEQMGKQVVRIGGANRFEVGVNLADYFNVKPSSIVFARGDSFPDALSGGPLAGLTQSPILLTMPNSLPTPVDNYLSAHQTVFQKGYILGGTASVSTAVEQKISSYMVNQ